MHHSGFVNASSGGGRITKEARRSILARLLRMAWSYHWNCLDALFWSLLVQVLMLGGFIFSGLAIDLLRHSSRGDFAGVRWPFDLHPPSDWSMLQCVVLASSLVLGFTLLRSLVHYESRMADERLVQKIVVGLRVRLYEKLQRMR